MKFITENDLRVEFRTRPFREYELPLEARLTPGARQFMADKRVKLLEPGAALVKPAVEKEMSIEDQMAVKRRNRLTARARTLETLFLEIGYEFLATDICLAQEIMGLQTEMAGIRAMLQGGDAPSPMACTPCTGMNPENFSDALGDCFEITPFHIQSEKGRQILMLDKLRCALNEFAVLGTATEENKALGPRVNPLINTLSQMICTAFGGKECQRKN